MKKQAILLGKAGLKAIYSIEKLAKPKDKVVFLSRQSDEISEDFRMVQELLKEKRPEVEIVTICNRLVGEGSESLKSFAFDTLKSMKEMANAKAVVLDTYWPAASMLPHRKELRVIQMWHAMGKIKQSGYQTLGKESGRNAETAKLMDMHRNYDYIIAGGPAWNPYYCASFDTTEDKLRNYGLPRIDRLINTADEKQKLVVEKYPELLGKKIVLYAPTFRRNIELHWEGLIEQVLSKLDKDYVLVVKAHPNQKLELPEGIPEGRVMLCPELKTEDFLSSAEYLITDYSATAVEGAVLNVKTLYFVYDYEEYREKNGMNIDLFEEMPGCVFRDAAELVDVIKNGSYDQKALDRYRKKFLPEELGTSTKKIVDLIIGVLDGRI